MKTGVLEISHCNAWVGEKQILHDVSLTPVKGTVTVVMGPNGSGKSTLAHVVMGDPTYGLKMNGQRSKIRYDGKDMTDMPTEERARLGVFLSFQTPVPIPGVSVIELLRTSCKERTKAFGSMKEFLSLVRGYADMLRIPKELLTRGVNDGFSGGERKKIELLQALVLNPSFAIFDEIDTGLDVDALRMVGKGIQLLKEQGAGIIIITHNHKILSSVAPDTVIVMDKGRVVKIGDATLAKTIDEQGFKKGLMIKEKFYEKKDCRTNI